MNVKLQDFNNWLVAKVNDLEAETKEPYGSIAAEAEDYGRYDEARLILKRFKSVFKDALS